MPVVEIAYEDLIFDPHVQEMCVSENFTCPHYGHSWACPPEAPFMDQELARFCRFFLVYFGLNIDDYVAATQGEHPDWSDEFIRDSVHVGVGQKTMEDGYLTELQAFLDTYPEPYEEKRVFWCGGSCNLCENPEDGGCTHDDKELCRRPEEIHYSMEAVGINVDETVKKSGIELEWPPVHWTYRIGLVCFR